MRIACIGEGDTEFVCVPKIVGRLGHTVVSNANLGGCAEDWDQSFSIQIVPYVKTAALKNPDKILIVVDREKRPDCPPKLAARASAMVAEGLRSANLQSEFAVIVSDRKFEAIVMSDYDLVDKMEILDRPVSCDFGAVLDGKDPKGIVDGALGPGKKYHKVRHGGALASKMRLEDDTVLSRSRSLRKLVKELANPG